MDYYLVFKKLLQNGLIGITKVEQIYLIDLSDLQV